MASNPNSARITDPSWAFMERVLTLSSVMRNAGIYANKPGFHNTRNANSSTNYSVQGVRNQRGPGDKAAGYDITYTDAQAGNYSTISVHCQRLYVAGKNRDPRMKGWYEFFGNVDWDSYVEGWSYAKGVESTSDRSHLWHCHLSECREMLWCWINKDGCFSVMSGESLGAWKTRLGFPQQYCGVNLQLNTWGAAVCLLQTRLGISADGEFGPNTQAAVINFQRSRGIGVDGIVGPRTWAELAKGQSGGTIPPPKRRKTLYLATCKPAHGDTVFFGDGNFHRPIPSMKIADDLASTGSVWRSFTDVSEMLNTIGPMPLARFDDMMNVLRDIDVAAGADPATIAKAVVDEEARRLASQ